MSEEFGLFYLRASSAVNFLTSILAAFTILSRNTKSSLNRSFFYLAFSISFWTFFYFLWLIVPDAEHAILFCKLLMLGAIFIVPSFLHFSVVLIGKYTEYRYSLYVIYAIAFVFAIIDLTSSGIVRSVEPQMMVPHWPMAGKAFPPFLALFAWSTYYTHYLVYRHYDRLTGVRKLQIRYVFLGTLTGFLGGMSNFPLWFDIQMFPYGNILVAFYVYLIAFSIIKYKLMNINVVITKAGVVLMVYTLVLGIPIWLAIGWQEELKQAFGENWWLIPFGFSTILATIGPLIHHRIQKSAEEKLLKEQKRYQHTLRQASSGMGRIKELNRLLNLIVGIVTRTVRLEHTMIYLIDEDHEQYRLAAVRSWRLPFRPRPNVSAQSILFQYMRRQRRPLVHDEIRQRTEDQGDLKMARLEQEMIALDASVVVPSFVDERIIGFLVMGRKVSGKLYSDDDLSVFSILANQAALAIENALFYEEMRKTHEQLVKAEKMATIGTMADGLSHQINNRLHAMGFIAGDLIDTVRLSKKHVMSDEVREVLTDLEHGLARIEENVTRGGEVVRGVLRYTRHGEEGFTKVELNKLLNAVDEMTQFKIRPGQISIARDFDSRTPCIKGNFTQLQEVFFNLIDNAYDAMIQRKQEMKEDGFHPTIRISVEIHDGDSLSIYVEDNGIGIKDKDAIKLFTPFFTTKLSSKRGTGLGLYVIQRLIEENHGGKVSYTSQYRQGTRVHLQLPVWKDSDQHKNQEKEPIV